MIIVCQKCDTRLQVDEAKVPSGPFVIRCPKCNSSVEAGSPSSAQKDSTQGSEATVNEYRFEQPNPAPLFEPEQKPAEPAATASADKLAELLQGLVTQPSAAARNQPYVRPSWNPRKALVCVPDEYRNSLAQSLVENGYQVFVAQDTRQAVDRMRENLMDVVLLDSRFDPTEQGPIFVSREVNILRPAQRRRLFFVLLSPTLRTMDSHTAFLNNVNAIINTNELEQLPKIIEHRVREFNEFYRDFNYVLEVPAL
ncbi:MAG TPA: zinc-ribbon domain-containing protein [Pyrinomonadaceae bacterium]|nr:zinc-ribbon domain-containing protein [Pyrinomonadaceae bacterium]